MSKHTQVKGRQRGDGERMIKYLPKAELSENRNLTEH